MKEGGFLPPFFKFLFQLSIGRFSSILSIICIATALHRTGEPIIPLIPYMLTLIML